MFFFVGLGSQSVKIKHIHFRKSTALVLYYKYTHSKEDVRSVNIAPKRKCKGGDKKKKKKEPPLLNPKGKTVSKQKMNDLENLLPFVSQMKGNGRVVVDDRFGNTRGRIMFLCLFQLPFLSYLVTFYWGLCNYWT